MERIEVLTNHYTNYNEDARFSTKAGAVEFLTTVNYIERYLRPGFRVIEVGAGTGRYSHYFAQKGYAVDAIELVEHNIGVFKETAAPGENVTIAQGDAVNLEGVPSDTYDITLLLGPMYHLYTDDERHAAISEAIRVTKPGGIIFAAYCGNDCCAYSFLFGHGGIKQEHYKSLIDFETFKLHSTPEEIFALCRKEDIDRIMAVFDVTRLHYIGTDMLTSFISSEVNEMDGETFEMYMKYHFCICERADMVGISSHMLDVFRKGK